MVKFNSMAKPLTSSMSSSETSFPLNLASMIAGIQAIKSWFCRKNDDANISIEGGSADLPVKRKNRIS